MTASAIFSELSDLGIRVRADGPDLVLSPKSALTANLTSKIKLEKPALIKRLHEIKRKAGPDWDEIANDPAQLEAFAGLIMVGEMREQGIVPDHYRAVTECIQCGSVPIFEGLPRKVKACPWCFNRKSGLPMPSCVLG